MSEKKIDNTFMRSMEQINNLEKVFREGGMLEKAVMDIKGDVAWLKDIREALSDAYESLEEGHIGTTGHMDVPEESVEENRMGFSDLEKLGKENASKVDMEARRQGSADMEPGDADKLRYKIAKKMGLVEGVLDSDDDDGFMARSQLYFMARDAIQLHGMIDDKDDLEPWVQSKIAQSAEAIDAVRRYTEYNGMKQQPEMEPEMEPEMDEGYTLLPPMDKEKYQARDGLEGPIPTKSGKVLYYDPKAGKYYDPDKDMYVTYDEWKQYDESMVESIMEDCGCEKEDDLTPIMRYLQLKAEGREEEANQLAEALPLVPLAVTGARIAAQRAIPWVIRQIAGKGAGNVAKSVAKRGVARTGKVLKRAMRRGSNKAKAAGSAAGNAAIHAIKGPGVPKADMDYLTKMTSSADEGKPATLNEVTKNELAAIGRKLQDMSHDNSYKIEIQNMFSRVGEHLENFGEPFGPKNLAELSKAAVLEPKQVQQIITLGKKKLDAEGDVSYPDREEQPAEGANFVKNIRAQLEGKYKNDAQRKAVHANKAEKK